MGATPAVPGRSGSADFVARVRSVTFKTDHRDSGGAKLLKGAVDQPTTFTHEKKTVRFASKLSEQGAVSLSKPDWSLAIPRNDPVSHTMCRAIRVDVEILFKKVPNGSAALQRVLGAASNVIALTFDVGLDQVVRDGDVVMLTDVISAGPLPTVVGIIDASIKWSAVVDGRPVAPIGNSGPHKVFVTLDQPKGQVRLNPFENLEESGPEQAITIPRLEFAVRGARGANTERRAADLMFEHFTKLGVNYALRFVPKLPSRKDRTGIDPRPSPEHYLWLCVNNQARGECQIIAAAFRLVLRTVGVNRPMEVAFMNPHPGRQEHTPDFPRRIDIIKGRLNVEATRTGGFHLIFLDRKDKPNNFEGVIKFDNALYAIGDAIFDRNTVPVGGISVDDLNATDYFTDRPDVSVNSRSPPFDASKGAFDLKYVDNALEDAPFQYTWATIPDAPPHKRSPGADDDPFRWED